MGGLRSVVELAEVRVSRRSGDRKRGWRALLCRAAHEARWGSDCHGWRTGFGERAADVRERLVEAVEGEPRAVRIDLSGVTFLDSTAVGLLVSTRRRVVSYGGAFSVRCESQVRQVIDTMGLLNFLNCS